MPGLYFATSRYFVHVPACVHVCMRACRRLKNAEKALGLDVKNASAEHEQKAAAKARAKAALTGAVEQVRCNGVEA